MPSTFDFLRFRLDDDRNVVFRDGGRFGGPGTLIGIERLQFSDRTIARDDGAPLVDDIFYFGTNRDVALSGVDADDHYAQFGFREGRDPSAFFSTAGYLSANPDVAASGRNPLEHYAQFGFREGRDPSVFFDVELYLRANPDVRSAGVDPLAHFLTFGQDEGRRAFAAIGKPGDIAP
jgi:hypothetical protein